jgi:Mn2+/Fe2+ NRAMP family transporter
MTIKSQQNTNIQLIWGVALTLVGIGVILRIPQVMPRLEEMEQFSSTMWFIRFCFYLMGVILIGGGIKKILNHFRPAETLSDNDNPDQVENGSDR